MKNLRVIPFLFATLLIVSSSVAQTTGGPLPNDLSESGQISAARSKYLERAVDTAAPEDSQTEAQMRRGPGVPMPPQREYYRGSYPTPWMADSDSGHVLIGAGLGFAVGAAIGAAGAIHNGTPVGGGVFIGGSLFALFGAAIGASHAFDHPFVHRRRAYPAWPGDDEETVIRPPASHKNSQSASSGSTKPAVPTQPRGTQARTAASPELPPVTEEPSVRTVSSPKTQQWQNFSGQLKPW